MKRRWICFIGSRVFVLMLLIQLPYLVNAQQLAFPGAQGGGRFAVGGRTGSVYEVTNLNDSGVGSLRDAVSQPNRTVIFKVSGIIHLLSKLSISKNNITIAGQTAPGDGICITGNTFNIKASDVIVRYIRCRLTDINDIVDDSMNGYSGPYQNIIIDHCSLSWSVDETGTFYDIQNFTLQWCLLSESLYHSVHNKGDHGYAGIRGGTNASFHHNLLAHHTSRNPRFGGSRYTGRPDLEVVDFRNNVLYNWGNINSAYGGEGGNYNMVNNYYKPGPATPGNLTTSSASNKRNRILNYTSYYYASDSFIYPDTLFGGKFYINGNYVEGYPDVTADNWTKGVQPDGFKRATALMQAAKQNAPFVVPPVRTETAQNAYASVLDSVGAILPRRDPVDKRVVQEARTGTATFEGATYAAVISTGISHPSGIIDTQSDVGGLPTYTSAVPLTDTDHDGLPDAWEVTNSLNPNSASDGNLIAVNGYSNLENYLNSIVNTDVSMNVSGTLSNFIQVVGTPTNAQTYTISGINLTGNISITPPVGYEVSADGGTNWYTNSAPLSLTPSNGRVLSTTISVRLNGNVADGYSGYIMNETNGTTAVKVAVRGITSNVTVPPAGVAVTVAKDGSGNFTTVQAAIDAAPTGKTTPYIIFIKNGKYKEKINIPSTKPFLQLVGESVANTILTFDDYSGKPIPGGGTYGTSNSASVTVNAADFSAINITFENSTGDSPQALAINVNADRVAFKNCRFLGGQDTVLANGNGNRQYFKSCYIDGTVDFIFGNAIAVFDSCVVHAKTRQDNNTSSYITAANTQNGQPYGYVFRGCTIPSNAGVTKYVLGRPWQNSTGSSPLSFPKVVFINTTIGYNIIKPEGWAIWDAGTVTTSIYDAEYKSKKFNGNLVDISQRVPWSFQLTDPQAANYSNATLFGSWDPCSVSSDFCTSKASVIAVTNFIGRKGASTTAFSWNIAWPKSQVKYELFRSSDNIAFSKINEQLSLNDTTIIYSYSEPVPPPASTYYYYVKASKNGFDSHITETVQISSTSTIGVTGTLNNFLQGVGLPSSQQAYTVSGDNLLNNIIIVPPPGFEVSANGGTTWFTNTTPLVLTQNNGAVTPKTIFVRLNATTAGTYNGNIVHTSGGASTVTVAANGTVQSDPLPISNILLYWPMSANNNDDAASRATGIDASTTSLKRLFVSNGTTVGAVPAYSSLSGQAFGATSNGDGTWSTGTGGPGGNLNRRFYEQFTVKALTDYNVRIDSIILTSSFYNTSSNTKLAIVYSKSGFTAADSTDVTGGVSGGIPLVSGANGAFATPALLINETAGTTKNYRFALAGSTGVTINAGQTLYIRAYFSCGSSSVGRYGKVKNVYVKGLTFNTVLPTIKTSAALNNFSQTTGTPSATQVYTVSGSNLTGNLTITPPAGYEVSSDGGTAWFTNASPLILVPVSGSVSNTSITVRLNATVAGSYPGNITHSSEGASTINVLVSGTATDAVVPTVTANGTLSNFSQTTGTPSATQVYTASGNNLTGNLTITPPTGYEVSSDGGTTWFTNASPLILVPVSGSVSNTSITVRLNAIVAGSYPGNITHSSTGASTINVSVSGTATNAVVPTITTSATLSNFSQTVGNPSASQTYTVSGSNLSGNITITPPAHYEVSRDGAAWFNNEAPLNLAPVSGAVSETTLSIRLNALVSGTYAGTISHTTTGSPTVSVEVNGTASPEPVTGILEAREQLFSVSPNPAHAVLVVHHPLKTSTTISVYSISGMEVGSYTSESEASETVIDISSMTSGLYFVRFIRKNAGHVMMKFVKQ